MPQPTYQMLRDFMALPESERMQAVQHPTLGPMLQDFLDAGGEGRRDILDTLRVQEQPTQPSPVTPESARTEIGSFNPINLLKSLAYDFTVGPFEEAGRVLSGPSPSEREHVISAMSPDERAAYLESGRGSTTPLSALMDTGGNYSDPERMALLNPIMNLGLIGVLGSRSVGGVNAGPGTGFFRRTPEASPSPPPRPMKALPPSPLQEVIINGQAMPLVHPDPTRALPPAPAMEITPGGQIVPRVATARGIAEPSLEGLVPSEAPMSARAIFQARRNIKNPQVQLPSAESSGAQLPKGFPEAMPTPSGTSYETPPSPLPSHPTIEAVRMFDRNVSEAQNLGKEITRLQEAGLPVPTQLTTRLESLNTAISRPVASLYQDISVPTVEQPSVVTPQPPQPKVSPPRDAATQSEQAYRAAEHQAVTGGTAAPRMAPVEYAGYQEGFGKVPGFHQYTLTEDLSPQFVKGSTVSGEALRRAGYEVPPPPPLHATQPKLFQTQATMPPEGLQAKVPQGEHGKLLEGMTPEEPARQAGLPFEGPQELHAGLPIPPKVKEWAKRNIASFGRAAAQTGRTVASEPASLLDRAASAEQRLRDVQQLLTQPRPPTASGSQAAGASSATPPRPPQAPIASDTPLNELPRYYNTALANQNRTRPFLSGGYHGMNQIAEAAPEPARAFRRASNAEHAWNYAVTEAKDLISQRVGSGAWDRFNQTMAQSQLNGSVRRWRDLARELASADPHDVPVIYRERAGDALLSAGAEPFKIGEQINNRFKAAATDAGKLANAEKLQQHLVNTFTDASERVAPILPQAEYQARLASPEFRQALSLWKTTVGNDLRAAHLQHNGHLLRPEYLGETGEYFPLTGKAASEQAAAGLRGPRPAGPYSPPGNPLNFRRSGLSPEYDLSTEALQRRIASAGWAADNAKAIAQAEADGLIRKIPPGTPVKDIPRTYDFRGVTYKAERVGDHVMPSWVRDEIGSIFERFRPPGPPTGALGWAANKIVGLNTKLGVDKFFHYVNETGMLGAQAPTIGRTALGRTVGSLPGIKTAHAFTTLFNSLADSERPMVREMLHNAEWYPRFKDNGELTGMARRDLAGRLTFRQAILRWKPNATPQELYDASTRFGEYNPQLASNAVRSIKQSPTLSPLAPFITAGNAFVRNALGTLTLQGPGGAAARLTAAATGGIPAALGTWVAIHLGMTGRLPDPMDRDFKFLQVPYGDTPDGRTKYLNVGRAVSPLFNRGARASGITGALETLARGGTSSQAFESALGDIVNAQVHPYTGPVVKVGTRLFAGVDPQIQFQGGGMNVRRAHPPTETLPGQIAANVKSAAEAVNPAAERISKPIERALGVPGGHDPTEGMSAAEQAAQAIGLVSVSDNRQRARMLHWSAKQTQRAARRAQR